MDHITHRSAQIKARTARIMSKHESPKMMTPEIALEWAKKRTTAYPNPQKPEPVAEEPLPDQITALIEHVPNPQIVITRASLERETAIIVGSEETTRLMYHVQRHEIAAEAARIAGLPSDEREEAIRVAFKERRIEDIGCLRYATIVELWLKHEDTELKAHWDKRYPALPTIQSDEDYVALPPGQEFIAPDGSRRRKAPLPSNQPH